MQPGLLVEFAPVEACVEMLQQPHVAERVERDAAGEHQPVAAGGADKVIDDVHQCVLEHHLGRRRLVEPLLRIFLVLDVFDAQYRVRIPHVLRCERLPENADEFGGIGFAQNVALPIGEIAVDGDAAFRLQAEDRLQRGVIGVGVAIAIAIGGGAHVAAFARQPGPATLGR